MAGGEQKTMKFIGNTPFTGTVWLNPSTSWPNTNGRFRMLGGKGVNLRISGQIDVINMDQHGVNFQQLQGRLSKEFNPFLVFGVYSLKGRTINIEIPGVGIFPAQLYSPGMSKGEKTSVDFHSWCSPVPRVEQKELARILRTPIHDALIEGGHDELAALALAAAVGLAGWPANPSTSHRQRSVQP